MATTYEAHITVPAAERALLDRMCEDGRIDDAWTTSAMTDDPALGRGQFAYLTAHSEDLVSLAAQMYTMRLHLQAKGIEVLRMKIELEVYDWRPT